MKKIGLLFGLLASVSLISTNVMACNDPAHCKCKHHNSKKHKAKDHSHHANMPPVQTPKPDPMLASCKAEGLQYLVGKNKSVLATMKFAKPIRIEEPGMMYTMEYSAERTRIITDEKGIITSVICG